MTYFQILFSVIAFTSNGFAVRLFQTRFKDPEKRLPLFQSLYCLISTICFWGMGRFALPTLQTFLYGLVFGILFCTASAMSAKAMSIGSMALSSVIMNMGLLIPILYSVIFLHEELTLLHLVGFILFCVSVTFSAFNGKESKKANLLWLVVVFIGLISNGLTATIQKIYIMTSQEVQDSVFLGVAYATASFCFIIKHFISKRGHTGDLPKRKTTLMSASTFLAVALIAGVGSFIGNLLLGKLSIKVIAAILYPCINGGLAAMTTLVSFFIFKEKPTLKKILSIIFGCAAIIILNLG